MRATRQTKLNFPVAARIRPAGSYLYSICFHFGQSTRHQSPRISKTKVFQVSSALLYSKRSLVYTSNKLSVCRITAWFRLPRHSSVTQTDMTARTTNFRCVEAYQILYMTRFFLLKSATPSRHPILSSTPYTIYFLPSCRLLPLPILPTFQYTNLSPAYV